MMNCIFCDILKRGDYYLENDLAVAFFDAFPVSEGHTLIIPKRHCENYFDLTEEELTAMQRLSQKVKAQLDEKLHPDGFNVGFNVGLAGGQTVMHCHMHVIPRYQGDSENPRGGVRKVVKKNNY